VVVVVAAAAVAAASAAAEEAAAVAADTAGAANLSYSKILKGVIFGSRLLYSSSSLLSTGLSVV
jgi:hypothetical protein